MNDIVEQRFNEWVPGKSAAEARVSIYERIRDIPYATIPELNDSTRYVEILRLNRGSCTPKHFLLCNMYHRLGMTVLYAVYPFRWDEVEIDYPPKLLRLAKAMPLGHHLACRVEIDGRFVLVDATLDLPLGKVGLPVNQAWDGKSDTLLPITPSGAEELHHPSEATGMQAQSDPESLAFYDELNLWLDEARRRVAGNKPD